MEIIIPVLIAGAVAFLLYSISSQKKATSGMDDGIKMQKEVLDLLKKSIQLQEDTLKAINELKLIKQMEVGYKKEKQ